MDSCQGDSGGPMVCKSAKIMFCSYLFVFFPNILPWAALLKKILQSELEEEKHCLESSPGDMVAADPISQEFIRGEKKFVQFSNCLGSG